MIRAIIFDLDGTLVPGCYRLPHSVRSHRLRTQGAQESLSSRARAGCFSVRL